MSTTGHEPPVRDQMATGDHELIPRSRLVGARGAVFYDADCRHCRRLATLVRPGLARRRINVVPLQSEGAADLLGVTDNLLLEELRMITPRGERVAGADAIVAIGREVPLAGPLVPFAAALPGAMPLLRGLYRRVADARGCVDPRPPGSDTGRR